MKKQLRTSTPVKVLAILLALVLGVGGFWTSLLTMAQWDNIWGRVGYYGSNNYYSNLYNRVAQVRQLARLMQNEAWDGSLSYLDQQLLSNMKEILSAGNTNFRFRLLDNATGSLVYTNLEGGALLESTVHQVRSEPLELTRNTSGSRSRADYQTWDQVLEAYRIHIVLPDGGTLDCAPGDSEQAAQYGWTCYDPFGSGWEYDSKLDSRILTRTLAVEYGVCAPLTVDDEFAEGALDYQEYVQYLPSAALLALVLDLLTVLLVIFLCLGAGRRRGQEGVTRNLFDRIPLDLLVFGEFWAILLLLAAGDSMAWAVNQVGIEAQTIVGLAVISLGVGICLLSCLLTLATRIKTGTVFSNTLIWRLCRAAGRGCREIVRSWPLTRRVVVGFLLYLLGTVLTTPTVFLIPLYQGLTLYFLCRWTLQWRRVQEGTARIVGGDPSCKIDTGGKMYPDLREHAEQLNDLGGAISTAVDERLRSERFKAELITNVSHDLKTPLTSIINYVDLLKKEPIENPKAAEYIEVLDRKSQRLKKLTEDLVEASKASTGSLTVNRERLGMVQLVRQAQGEFDEKLAQQGLTLVSSFPEQEVYIQADGRHLWRILENLLSNCCKYALEGTRVYLDVVHWEGHVTLSVKNISRQPLNIPPDQLMERFVRGEESRTTEGSGLGLSIARSLTELQGGTFRLDIDGDLFKATVSFPEDGDMGSISLPA